MSDTSELTAEQIAATKFDPIPDLHFPALADWLDRAGREHETMRVGTFALGCLETDLAERVAQTEDVKMWMELITGLIVLRKQHETSIETLDAMIVRLTAAVSRAYPETSEARS